ncbi:hypothetical protein CCHR01_02232 [Colletotrichum chrysophilum]|uniref:Secreted protein n=1 Tax=Colletotrichum chrysophilum TaxID=1836956 RepID=A0AAD9EPN6_9PEZI|nr:hypothetical protein CCHR01_02232 [Colletotrichum chrysophilum]
MLARRVWRHCLTPLLSALSNCMSHEAGQRMEGARRCFDEGLRLGLDDSQPRSGYDGFTSEIDDTHIIARPARLIGSLREFFTAGI